MTDLIVLPPPKRTRSRRLRTKLRICEFQTLGFDYELTWQAHRRRSSCRIGSSTNCSSRSSSRAR